jgi:ATP-dependent DNA helicase RecG
LVEQTGRGADKIFMGQLRYGRPVPDYSRSDASGVRVVLRGGRPSLEFAAFVYEEDKRGEPLGLDELMVLNALYFERRIDSAAAGMLIQKGTAEGRAVLERLHERGLVEAKGEKKGRVYHLGAGLYRRLKQPGEYVRTHGIDKLRQEGLVMEYVEAHGRITSGDVIRLLGISRNQARRVIERMKAAGKLKSKGKPPRGAYYVAP